MNGKPSVDKPWMKYFSEEVRNTKLPKRTLYEAISENCNQFPDFKAIRFYGKVITYREMLNSIDQIADAFYRFGIREGEYVSYVTATTVESIMALYAFNKIGAIPNFIDPRMDPQRILDAANRVHSRYLFTLDYAYPKVMQVKDEINAEKIIVVPITTSMKPVIKLAYAVKFGNTKVQYGGNVISWNDVLSCATGEDVPKAEFKEDSVAAITYTGGTTGSPKGVMLTNDGINVMCRSFLLSGIDISENNRFLGIMPIFSSYGIGCGVHLPLVGHCELVLIPKFTPDELGGLIKKYKPVHMIAVPAFYEKIMNSRALRNMDLSFLRMLGCGGDTMHISLEHKFNAFLKEHGAPYPIAQGYGMSEMSGAATACLMGNYKDCSSGLPMFATTVAAFNPETGEELGYNERGELCMTGRNMMLGYYDMPEETDNVIRTHADGTKWVHSGDIGYVDEDGFVFIDGRIKQIIVKFDGHKIFPVSIENLVGLHPAVEDCAVIGVKDPHYAQGDVPICIVKVKEDVVVDKAQLRKELLVLCNDTLEERGKPADITFIDSIPYTGFGKHAYTELKELYKEYKINEEL